MSESRYDERVHGGGAGIFERFAVRDWRAITALFATSTFLESLALGHLMAFTPLFLSDDLHLPESEVATWTGLLSAATFAVAFPLAPLWGALAERYSRKLIIVRSQYLEALAYVMCALSPDLTWFFVARLLLGLTFGNFAITTASQSLTPEARWPRPSRSSGSGAIAVTIGPLGALLPIIGTGLFLVDGFACLVAAVLVTFCDRPARPTHRVLASMRGSDRHVRAATVLRWNFVNWY